LGQADAHRRCQPHQALDGNALRLEHLGLSRAVSRQAAVMSAPTFVDLQPPVGSFLDDVLCGLDRKPKAISPKYFYDARGSELFEAICELPEYYPTRTELALT